MANKFRVKIHDGLTGKVVEDAELENKYDLWTFLYEMGANYGPEHTVSVWKRSRKVIESWDITVEF